jgi:hypothetical protein
VGTTRSKMTTESHWTGVRSIETYRRFNQTE